jgi:hypothetical protein
MRRRPPTPAQVELPLALVALAAAVAALVQALSAVLLHAPGATPHWAQPAGAGILAVAALLSLLLGRLTAGRAGSVRVRALRWVTLALIAAAGALALAAGLSSG